MPLVSDIKVNLAHFYCELPAFLMPIACYEVAKVTAAFFY